MIKKSKQAITDKEFLTVLKLYENCFEKFEYLKTKEISGYAVIAMKSLPATISFHARSSYYLTKGLPKNDKGNHLKEPYMSVLTLTRATLESIGVLHFLLLETYDKDELQFRSLYYAIQGLLLRQKFPMTHPEYKKKQKEEVRELNKALKEISKTQYYKNSLTVKQQEAAKKGKWKIIEKAGLLEASGFGKNTASRIYSYLSDYAHSGYLLSLQFADPIDSKRTCYAGLLYMAVGLSLCITRLGNLYGDVQSYIDNQKEEKRLVEDFAKAATAFDHTS
jgi:hypothetical protein